MRYLKTDCTWFQHLSSSIQWCKKNFLDCILPDGFCVVAPINKGFEGCSNWWGDDAFWTSLEMCSFLATFVLLGMNMICFWWKKMSLRVVVLIYWVWHLLHVCVMSIFAHVIELCLKWWHGGFKMGNKTEAAGASSETGCEKKNWNNMWSDSPWLGFEPAISWFADRHLTNLAMGTRGCRGFLEVNIAYLGQICSKKRLYLKLSNFCNFW